MPPEPHSTPSARPAPAGCPWHATARAISSALERAWQTPGPDGRVPRAFHDKTHACLNATFHVEPPAEPRFRQGLFATRKSYPATLRLSSGVFDDDAKPDARGFALKLRDVDGELCEGAPAGQHDIILTSVTALAMRDAADALHLQEVVAAGGQSMAAKLLPWRYIFPSLNPRTFRWYYFTCMLEPLWRDPRRRGLLSGRYFSVSPYRLGDYAVKYEVRPAAGSLATEPSRGRSLTERLQTRLDRGPAWFDFFVQPAHGPREPLDDVTVRWKTPLVRVARIEIPSQPVAPTVPLGETLSFNPWHCLRAHEPLGSLNAVRRDVYRRSAELRHAAAARESADLSGP